MEWELLSIVFALAALFATIKWRKAKKLLTETVEALTAISVAIHDDTISREEWTQIVDELDDVVLAFQDLVK